MASAVGLRADYSAAELRRLAAATKNANQSRRLLSLAAVLDGMDRTQAARIGGMDRQTLRDWVPLQPAWPRRAPGQLIQRSRAAPLAGATSRVRRARRDRPGHTSARSASSSRGSASPTSAPARA